jgi:hypothetical protein
MARYLSPLGRADITGGFEPLPTEHWQDVTRPPDRERRQWPALLRSSPVEPPPGQARTRRLRWAEVEQEGRGDPVPHGSLQRWAQKYPEIPGQDQVASKVRLAGLTARLRRRQTRRTSS